jgi:hypothetical protein
MLLYTLCASEAQKERAAKSGWMATKTLKKKPLKLSSLGGLYQLPRAKPVLPLIPSVT